MQKNWGFSSVVGRLPSKPKALLGWGMGTNEKED